MATRKKSSRRKKAATPKMKRAGRAARSRSVRGRSVKKRGSSKRSSAVARAKRVARGVVQQATVAVVSGVDSLKELGETLVDRVRGEQ